MPWFMPWATLRSSDYAIGYLSSSYCVSDVLGLIFWSTAAFAASSDNWIYPDGSTNHTYNFKDELVAMWDTPDSNPTVQEWCGPNADAVSFPCLSYSNLEAYREIVFRITDTNASINEPFTGDSSCGPNVTCVLILYTHYHIHGLNSSYFSVTEDDAAQPSTWSASLVAASTLNLTTTQTPTPFFTTGVSSTLPAQFTQSSTSSPLPNRPSAGASVGIGIGTAAGAILLAIAAFVLYKRRQRLAQNRNSNMGLMEMRVPDYYDSKGDRPGTLPDVQQPAIGELDIDSPVPERSELDSPDLRTGELDDTSTIIEMNEPRSSAMAGRDPGRPDEQVYTKVAAAQDDTEREEIKLGESIR